MGLMRYGKAVQRLQIIAERCQRVSGLWDEAPPLTAAYAFGDVLDGPEQLDVVQLALVLNHPAEELTWCARPTSCSGLPHLLELEKAPVDWYWRPAAWPVSNPVIVRPLRIWSTDGVDAVALDALARRAAEPLRLPPPHPRREDEQFAFELKASLAYLQRVEDRYWERDWRAEHRGSGIYPENHLWDAVHGYFDLYHAVRARDDASGAD
jgi:hypothetical protein